MAHSEDAGGPGRSLRDSAVQLAEQQKNAGARQMSGITGAVHAAAAQSSSRHPDRRRHRLARHRWAIGRRGNGYADAGSDLRRNRRDGLWRGARWRERAANRRAVRRSSGSRRSLRAGRNRGKAAELSG